jgi:CubicO group peptidase (beta-lactamase class C family)
VRELLEHTGGLLRDGLDADYWQFDRPFPDRDELLALVRDGGPKAEPGERFAYSNLGYSLLGLLVEAVTGDSFARAAEQRIVGPLGLQHTAVDYLADRSDDYAVGYTGLHTEATHRRLEHVHTGAMAAATGFTSTATDLVAYFAAHGFGDTRLLSDRTKRLQQRRANDIDPKDDASGAYGWGMGIEDIDGETFVGHGGGYPGHITKTLLDPASGLVVSVLTNAIDGPASALAKGVVQLLRRAQANADGTRTPAAERSRESVDPASVLKLTGRYGGAWGVTDIALLGGRLTTVDPTSWAPLEGGNELEPVAEGRLRIASGSGTGSVGEYVTFDLADDVVRSLRYGGMTLQPRRELPPLY